MRLALRSDLHFEFYDDAGLSYIKEIDPSTFDILILAGDVADVATVEASISLIARQVYPKPILHVAGNHEYYGGSVSGVQASLRKLEDEVENYHFLCNEAITVEGQHFVGSTLWYRPRDFRWSDFRHIALLNSTILDLADEAKKFLAAEVRPGSIVITHMMPSWKCVLPRWQSADSNSFFVHDVEAVIFDKKPKLWLYGHGHDVNSLKIDETQLYCRPRGYPHEDCGAPEGEIFTV